MKNWFLLLLCLSVCYAAKSNEQGCSSVPDSLLYLAQNWKRQDSLAQWLNAKKKISQHFRSQGFSNCAIGVLEDCLRKTWKLERSAKEHRELAWVYVNKAYLLEQSRGDFLGAKKDYEKAVELFDKLDEKSFNVARFVWQPLGNIYTRLGENQLALFFLKRTLSYYQNQDLPQSEADAYNDIGLVHINKGNYEKAIEYFEKGIDKTAHNQGLLYSNKAKAHLNLNQLKEGEQSVIRAIHLLQAVRNKEETSDYLVGAYTLYGRLLSKKGNYTKANQLYQEALSVGQNFYQKKHRKLAYVYLGIAENEYSFDQARLSLEAGQEAMKQCISSFSEDDVFKNPSTSQLYAEVTVGKSLLSKAKAATRCYEKYGDENYLHLAKDCYQLFFKWEKFLRKEYFYEASKLSLTADIHRSTEEALNLLVTLQEKTQEKDCAEMAFQWMEQTKGILLSESISAQFNTFKELKNDAQLVRLQQLRKELFLTQQKSLEQEIYQLQKAIRTQNLAFNDFLIQTNHPLSTDKLTLFLSQHQSNLISYFVGDSTLFVSLIHEEQFYFFKLNAHRFDEKINRLTKQLQHAESLKAHDYMQSAHQIYDLVIEPIQTLAKQPHWVIIGDGPLLGLSFDALVAKPEKNAKYKALDYLLYHKEISYAPSAKLLLQAKTDGAKPATYLGVAPNFENTSLTPLPYAAQEVEIGRKAFEGDILLDGSATKQQVLDEIATYQIVHLTSHAKRSFKNKMAWIAFSSQKNEENKLYLPELYPLSLTTDLLVLNACETASGPYRAGEGVYSFSRAFLYAGAQHVLTNLWQANHEANAQLLKVFYQELQQTNKPSTSLRQAKLAYLASDQTDEFGAHPYYWASLNVCGNNRSLNLTDEESVFELWWWMVVGLGLASTWLWRWR